MQLYSLPRKDWGTITAGLAHKEEAQVRLSLPISYQGMRIRLVGAFQPVHRKFFQLDLAQAIMSTSTATEAEVQHVQLETLQTHLHGPKSYLPRTRFGHT